MARPLGEFLRTFIEKLRAGTDPNDGCVLCGSTTRILHPVDRAWACSNCHQPPAPWVDDTAELVNLGTHISDHLNPEQTN